MRHTSAAQALLRLQSPFPSRTAMGQCDDRPRRRFRAAAPNQSDSVPRGAAQCQGTLEVPTLGPRASEGSVTCPRSPGFQAGAGKGARWAGPGRSQVGGAEAGLGAGWAGPGLGREPGGRGQQRPPPCCSGPRSLSWRACPAEGARTLQPGGVRGVQTVLLRTPISVRIE